MDSNAGLIERLYSSFSVRDGEAMAACYHPEAVFRDPVFTHLEGEEVGAMWRMFCAGDSDLELSYSDVRAEGDRGSAHWEALYTFPLSGRRVHNRIDATFEFQDGKILRHRDDFGLYRWTRMALGPAGWIMGWTPLVRSRIRRQADSRLRRFIADHPS